MGKEVVGGIDFGWKKSKKIYLKNPSIVQPVPVSSSRFGSALNKGTESIQGPAALSRKERRAQFWQNAKKFAKFQAPTAVGAGRFVKEEVTKYRYPRMRSDLQVCAPAKSERFDMSG